MILKDKTILITGGTSGIGLEIVKKLIDHNRVIVVSRKQTLPEELYTGNFPVKLYHADIGHKPALETVMDTIVRSYPSLDLLINNAAVQFTPEFLSDDFHYDAIQTEIDINFTAICHLTYLCLPLLQVPDRATILNVNSGLAIKPKTSSAIYCATKSALDSFSKSLRYQLQGSSISVMQAFLPLVQTSMTDGRGGHKLTAEYVADQIIEGIEHRKMVNDIGKVKILRMLNYLLPPVATQIMKAG